MADKVSMSLDDIIKKQRKQKPGVKGVKGFRGIKGVRGIRIRKVVGVGPEHHGKVSRNFTYQRKGPRGKASKKVSSRIGSNRYLNLPSNKGLNNGSGNTQRRINKIRKARGRFNEQQRPPRQRYSGKFQDNRLATSPPQRFVPGRGRRGTRTWARNNTNTGLTFTKPVRNINKDRKLKLKLAKKRLQRARQHLIVSRITGNIGTQGVWGNSNLGAAPIGRIRVGRFGLLTARKTNLQRHRATIQQKILRAQMARNHGESNSPLLRNQDVPHTPGRGFGLRPRKRFPGSRNPNFRENSYWQQQRFTPRSYGRERDGVWSHRFNLHSEQDRTPRSNAFRRSIAELDRSPVRRVHNDSAGYANDWDLPVRRLHNDRSSRYVNETEMDRSGHRVETRDRLSSALDPKIQNHISYIQQQGRRIRGEENYEPANNVLLSYSGMSLSERFKQIMN